MSMRVIQRKMQIAKEYAENHLHKWLRKQVYLLVRFKNDTIWKIFEITLMYAFC